MTSEYRVIHDAPALPHGNTKTGLPFHSMEVGDTLEVPPSEFSRTNSARAHFQKKMAAQGIDVKFTSRGVKNGETGKIAYHVFRRVR